MKIKEMRAMPVSEAERQVAELRAELAKERAVAAGGTRPENPGKIRGVRKNIARLLTVINEKKRAGENAGGRAVEKAPVGHAAKKAVEEKKPKAVAKQISQSFLQQQKGFAKQISPGFLQTGKKAVAKQVSQSFPSKPTGLQGKKSSGFSMLPTGKKAVKGNEKVKGNAKKGVKKR